MMRVIGYWLIICVVCIISVEIIKRYDEEEWQIKGWHWMKICAISGGNSILINVITGDRKITGLLLAVLAGVLLFACITDSISCQVFRFVWWIGLGTAGFHCCMQLVSPIDFGRQQAIVTELLIYVLLQECFFCRFYGRADCHGFALCAMVGAMYGMTLQEYLVHMLLAFALLAIHQIFRKNISKTGNLKRPVAFLPHITISFWIIMVKISV